VAKPKAAQVKSGDVDCGDCVASERCWSERLSPGAGFLVRRVRLLEAGEILFRQHAPFDAPYVVTSGCMSVTELLDDGNERIVAFRVPGEIIGLESWDRRTHQYGAQAVSSATLCRLRWSASGLTGRSSHVVRTLFAKSTVQLEQAQRQWAGLPAVERVRVFLEDFRGRTVQPLPMTRAQIGLHLGLAEETVVRAMRELRLNGAVI
jgi:CRP/FNR family transcriptional regulator, anaerobic regulatory protein